MILLESLAGLPSLSLPVIATMGNFDGLHRGHKRILRKVIHRAREEGGTSVVVTFEPHPIKVLFPERAPALIQTAAQKRDTLRHMGLQVLLEIPFTREFGARSAGDFIREISSTLHPAEIYIGEDFRFGHGRTGDIGLLKASGPELGFSAFAFPKLKVEKVEVSSSLIRTLLKEGDMARAVRLLGRPYIIEGPVLRGAMRGRTLGYPTANLAVENELVPALGVYAAAVDLGAELLLPAVANLGIRPTFQGSDGRGVLLEIHLLDWSGDLYDKRLRCLFFHFLRPERKFASADELKSAIGGDADAARDFLAAVPLHRNHYW
jgi:riboflavin kinase / FMN adenylyltransferase